MCSAAFSKASILFSTWSNGDQGRTGTEDRDHFFHTLLCHLICLGCILTDIKAPGREEDTFLDAHSFRTQSPAQQYGASSTLLPCTPPCPLCSLFKQGGVLNTAMQHFSRDLEQTSHSVLVFCTVLYKAVCNVFRSPVNLQEHSTDHVSQIHVSFRQRQLIALVY